MEEYLRANKDSRKTAKLTSRILLIGQNIEIWALTVRNGI